MVVVEGIAAERRVEGFAGLTCRGNQRRSNAKRPTNRKQRLMPSSDGSGACQK